MSPAGSWTTSTVHARWLSEGILEISARPGVREDLSTARANVRIHLEHVGDAAPVRILMDLTGMTSISREAREFYSRSEESLKLTRCAAVMVKTRTSRMIGNVLMALNHPSRATHMFTARADALAWLRAQP